MGLSRNKVAVPEGAAGSPPFYGEFSRMFVRWCAPRASHGAMAAGVAGVEDVVGFALPVVRWVPGWYGCAFGLPDRHPRLFAWRDSMPVVPGGRPCAGAMAWRCVVA